MGTTAHIESTYKTCHKRDGIIGAWQHSQIDRDVITVSSSNDEVVYVGAGQFHNSVIVRRTYIRIHENNSYNNIDVRKNANGYVYLRT